MNPWYSGPIPKSPIGRNLDEPDTMLTAAANRPSKANIHVDELLRVEKQFRNQKSQRNNAGFTYECTKFVVKSIERNENRIARLPKERILRDGKHQ